jgi:hypothetical protein
LVFTFSGCGGGGGGSSGGGDSSGGEVNRMCPGCPTINTTNIIANGWVWPVSQKILGQDWLHLSGVYYGYHLAVDLMGNCGHPVHAIADGTVLLSGTNFGGYGGISLPGGAIVVLHQTSMGQYFKALYGHVDSPLPVGSVVKAGDIIADLNNYADGFGPHLHFGISPGNDLPSEILWGYTGSTHILYGFVSPLDFLNNNHPLNSGVSVQVAVNTFLDVEAIEALRPDVLDNSAHPDLVPNPGESGVYSLALSAATAGCGSWTFDPFISPRTFTFAGCTSSNGWAITGSVTDTFVAKTPGTDAIVTHTLAFNIRLTDPTTASYCTFTGNKVVTVNRTQSTGTITAGDIPFQVAFHRNGAAFAKETYTYMPDLHAAWDMTGHLNEVNLWGTYTLSNVATDYLAKADLGVDQAQALIINTSVCHYPTAGTISLSIIYEGMTENPMVIFMPNDAGATLSASQAGIQLFTKQLSGF